MAVPDGWPPARVHAGAQNPAYRPARPPPTPPACAAAMLRSEAPVCSRRATGDIGGDVGEESFAPLPATAAWRHRGARSGFEVVYFGAGDDWRRIEGWTTAVEDGATWVVEYVIEADAAWATRSAQICGRSIEGRCSAVLEADGAGHWLVRSAGRGWPWAWPAFLARVSGSCEHGRGALTRASRQVPWAYTRFARRCWRSCRRAGATGTLGGWPGG